MKDERKVVAPPAPPSASSEAGTGASSSAPGAADPSRSVAGTKRRRDTDANVGASAEAQPAGGAEAEAVEGSQGTPAPAEDPPPVSKIKKLPPIKKNKSLAAVAGTSSGTASPNPAAVQPKSLPLPIHMLVPRKPHHENTDLDLSNSDIYKSLFKTVSLPITAPRH